MVITPAIDFLTSGASVDERYLGDVGFRWGAKGTHTSRTMMLHELTDLLSVCPPDASRSEYVTAVVDANCLGKRTAATRKLSVQRLSELYALDRDVLLFSVFRRLWYASEDGRELLALLLVLARDPLLRATAGPIFSLRPGQEVIRQEMEEALRVAVGDRLSSSILDKVIRNVASSWTQSGHLQGYSHKVRQAVHPTPTTAAYAVLLGYLTGVRGHALFETLWGKVLDCTASELLDKAVSARRLGFLDLTFGGGMVQVGIKPLLADHEEWDASGQDRGPSNQVS